MKSGQIPPFFPRKDFRIFAIFSGIFSDIGVRTGIKFAAAGILALYLALLLHLDEPTWAVTTAFVLSTPKFVGAIGEKTVLRIVGAIAGAVIGYLITGSLQQSPVFFLAAMGGLVAVTTALYGGALVPYGFRQCGYTATLVAAQGLGNPAFSWHVGLARCEEICLGIVVTMVVTTTIWPRYARNEFADDVRKTLQVLAGLFRGRSGGFLSGRSDPQPDVLGTIGSKLAKLRKLIRLGCMESIAFRRRRPVVDDVVSQLGVLGTALSNFGRTLPTESLFRNYIEREITVLHESMAEAIESLANPSDHAASRRAHLGRVAEGLRDYETCLLAFRRDGIGENLTDEESLEHAGYSLSIHEIFAALTRLDALLPQIEEGQVESFPLIRFERFTMPDAEWIKSGIRGALAVMTGLFFLNWLNPPGGDLLVVGTYLFTAFSLESPDRKGDLGVFSTLVVTALLSVAFFLFLVVMAPVMSSYAAFNILFGTALFLVGYFSEIGRISSFVTLIAMLMIVILVGLNAQHPVRFEDIVGPTIGLMLAVILSAVMRRLLWPSLPQNALRARLGDILRLLEHAAENPELPVPVPARAKIALSAADGLDLVGVLENKLIPPVEAGRLRTYIHSLARLGGHLMASAGSGILPARADALYREQRSRLLASIAKQLHLQRHAVEAGERMEIPVLGEDVRSWTSECRQQIRAAKSAIAKTSEDLGLLYRSEQSATAADESARIASTLSLATDFADSRL